MALSDFDNADIRLSGSPAESARFGFATDRLTIGERALDRAGSLDQLAADVARRVQASLARVVIVRYPSRLIGLIGRVDHPGFTTLPAGSLMYWQAPEALDGGRPAGTRQLSSPEREAARAHLDFVLADSFEGYVNHYSANPLLDGGVVVAGYQEWASRTMSNAENPLFIVEDDLQILGVAVVSVSADAWEIELASIRSTAQRSGHYLTLMRGVMAAAHLSRAPRVIISTQSHNIAVQRAWAKLDFMPIAAIDTLHLVRS